MRFGTLGIIASSLLAISSVALAQTSPDEIPEPPAPTHPLPPATPKAAPMSANYLPPWQTLQGGYGGNYGAWGDYGYGGGHGGCESCGTCCRACRPGLMFRIKSLKCKLCSAWACRKSCRQSCRSCGSSSCSSCSSCCGSDLHGYSAPTAAGSSDLPTPPPEPTRYEGDTDDMTDEPATQGAAMAPAAKQQYTMPRVTSSRKSVRKKKSSG